MELNSAKQKDIEKRYSVLKNVEDPGGRVIPIKEILKLTMNANVKNVVNHFYHIQNLIENIVLIHVTKPLEIEVRTMNRINLENYYTSVSVIKEMRTQGIINENEYYKMEKYLAKKYCIKNGSLYRLNDLIINDFRVIYVDTKKEVQYGTDDSDKNKSITKVG